MLTLDTVVQQGTENYSTLEQNISLGIRIGKINPAKLPTMRVYHTYKGGPKFGVRFCRDDKYAFALFELDNETLVISDRGGLGYEVIKNWSEDAELVNEEDKLYQLTSGYLPQYVSVLSDILAWCCEN